MPSIAGCRLSFHEEIVAVKTEDDDEISQSNCETTPQKRRLRSSAAAVQESQISAPTNWKSPRRCLNSSPRSNSPSTEMEKNLRGEPEKSARLALAKLSNDFTGKPNWNPRDVEQISAVKEALHVSTLPVTVVCRENEQRMVFDFCKACIEQEKAASLYMCGCPGTGKSLSMQKVKLQLVDWSKKAGFQPPDILEVNCTSLAKTSEIFSKIIGSNQDRRKTSSYTSPLLHLQNLYSQQQQSSGSKMMLIIADELDYLITKDRAVLHDLFMLTTYPFSRCILIGIANAIDLADRFLPRLQSLNCKPLVVTFRAYSKDQILRILQERLMALPRLVFDPQALELCARKVAAASGDMRKALCVCRSAVEILEAELRESLEAELRESTTQNSLPAQEILSTEKSSACRLYGKQENDIVRIDHMAVALSKAYRSPVVETIQSLPQHQQIILCSAIKFFRGGKKDATIGELNKSYVEVCKSTIIPPVGILEFSTMCRVLNDQGLLKLGQARDDKLRRITLKVDDADITFALQGIRFFRNCLR